MFALCRHRSSLSVLVFARDVVHFVSVCCHSPAPPKLVQLSPSDFINGVFLLSVWSLTRLVLSVSCCLTSTEARWPIRDGDRVGRGRESDRLDRGNRPKKTGETVDRRQDNVRCTAVDEQLGQLEAKDVQLAQPSSTSLLMISSGQK